MMKTIQLLFILLISSCFCFGQQGKFHIQGKIDTSAYRPSRMILIYKNHSMDYVFDTLRVVRDEFVFSGQLPEASRFKLSVEPDTSITSMNGKGKWELSFTMENCNAYLLITERGKWTLKGSECHFDEKLFRKVLLDQTKRLKGNDRIFMERSVIDSFIRAKPASFFSLILFSEKVRSAKETANLPEIFALLPFHFQNGVMGHHIKERIKKLTELGIGKLATDFSLPDLSGKLVSLSDFKGKYVMLHFWASWCNPCRQENGFLRQAYLLNNTDSLVFVGVSLDDERSALVKAIEADRIEWMQLAAFKGFDVEAATRYGIIGIPRNFLIDPVGRIIASDLRGEKIYDRIRMLIH